MDSKLIVNTPVFVSDKELSVAMGEHSKLMGELDELQAMISDLNELSMYPDKRMRDGAQKGLVHSMHAITWRMRECERLMEVIKRRSAYCAAERARIKQVLYMFPPTVPMPPHWA